MKVAKRALIISHGNADVESGFSTNESLLKENMKERSIVAQQVLHDAIRNAGGISKVSITKLMRTSVKHAKSAYKLSLSTDEEASRKLEEKNRKRKAAETEILALEAAKRQLTKDMTSAMKLLDSQIQALNRNI